MRSAESTLPTRFSIIAMAKERVRISGRQIAEKTRVFPARALEDRVSEKRGVVG